MVSLLNRAPAWATLLALAFIGTAASAKTIVFWQTDFPIIDSQPVSAHTLKAAFGIDDTAFLDSAALAQPNALSSADLLVLPYGSAFPQRAWTPILQYLHSGGNLLVIGGQPFRVPVTESNGRFMPAPQQDRYTRELGIAHTYEAPQRDAQTFAWNDDQSFLPKLNIHGEKFFVLEGRSIDGLGYMLNPQGEKIAAPVVVNAQTAPYAGASLGARWVFLDFQPVSGYWDTHDGISLIRTAADYARQGALSFWVETDFSTFRPGEVPTAVIHLRNLRDERDRASPTPREVMVDLISDTGALLHSQRIPCSENSLDTSVTFPGPLQPGFYRIRGTYYSGKQPLQIYWNGFWIEDRSTLNSGPQLGVSGDFLTKDGKPFFPFGTNYFSTETNGWDFSGPRNADVWEQDFADMERHNVSFVRTGVWGGQLKFLDQDGAVTERFLRNVEAYLLCARHHHIAVNFTFFAFDPQTTLRLGESNPVAFLPGSNPYLDPTTIRAEQNYVLSIVNRFKAVPYLSYDLINEPSFSNPRRLWRGNTPDNDPAEIAAWHKWLAAKYGTTAALAAAWSLTPDQLTSFNSAALPTEHDLSFDLEHGDIGQVRALDYNLFAQDMFSHWVETMVGAIRSTGSKQLIDVGQDEGGVTDRLLNQFYGEGLSFTTNHTYRENSALLWDSLAAKVPGIPNIVGETGYQPNILPNGQWQFDELTGAALIERKWIEGFAGATSGALSWDWARELYFGIERSDGSSKIWENTMREMGKFAADAAPYATALIPPEVAIVLPQSLQLSTLRGLSIEAQQTAVRALYGYARSAAYFIGEDQIQHSGNPKLIILPSPWVLNQACWDALLQKVTAGATLLVSGPFDDDPHFHATNRAAEIAINYRSGPLRLMQQQLEWSAGSAWLTYSGSKTNFLEQAFLPDNQTFVEKPIGRGKVLFVTLPIELNDNVKAVGDIYSYALQAAHVDPVYSSTLIDPGILIAPTRFPHATLYAITSESSEQNIEFRDVASGKTFSFTLDPGRGALLLIGQNGDLLASYNWK